MPRGYHRSSTTCRPNAVAKILGTSDFGSASSSEIDAKSPPDSTSAVDAAPYKRASVKLGALGDVECAGLRGPQSRRGRAGAGSPVMKMASDLAGQRP